MLTVVCENTVMLWVFPTAYKIPPFPIIRFILTILNNEQHPLTRVRVDEDGALENSTYVTNLLIEEFKISVETTGDDAYWLNGKTERNNRSIQNMVRSGLI